jgi:hypothetical protein
MRLSCSPSTRVAQKQRQQRTRQAQLQGFGCMNDASYVTCNVPGFGDVH